MKICVILDSDGHFGVSNLIKREETIKVLKDIHDGDYWNDLSDDFIKAVGAKNEAELLMIDDDKWEAFVTKFVQRGTIEIKEIKQL